MAGRWRWLPLTAALALHLAVLYAPSPDAPSSGVPGQDKAVHVLVFALPTWAGLRAGLAARWFVPALLAHSAVSEIVQALALPERSGDGWDVLADAVGVAVGVLAFTTARRRSPRRRDAGQAPV